MAIVVAVLEDDPAAYELLKQYEEHIPPHFRVHWQLSRTLVEDSLEELPLTGWVPGEGRSIDTYALYDETHDLLLAPTMPEFLIIVLDMDLIRSTERIANLRTIHGLTGVDPHLVGGLALAIQAINNPVIRELYIYLATRTEDTSQVESILRTKIASVTNLARAIEIKKNSGRLDTLEKAKQILSLPIPQPLIDRFTAEEQLEQFLEKMSGRSVKKNHEAIPPERPVQLGFLLDLLSINDKVAEDFFHFGAKGKPFDEGHLLFEALKEFGSGNSPSLSLLNVLLIALISLVRLHKKDVLGDPGFAQVRTWLQENHALVGQGGAAENSTLKAFARDNSILPTQSPETYRDSVMRLHEMLVCLFRNDRDRNGNCNLHKIVITSSSLTFVLNFPAKKLVRNLNTALKPRDAFHTDEGRGRNSTTAILRFLVRMKYSDQEINGMSSPGTQKFGSVARMNIEADGDQRTKLIFDVR